MSIFLAFGVGTTTGTTGTTIKFQPLTGTDTMIKNGTTSSINTRHMCITTMKDYENKSLEVYKFRMVRFVRFFARLIYCNNSGIES